jgi:UDP-N-acetylglucosamine acyltransferase
MQNSIHRTAIIGDDVKLGENNVIGANVIISGKVCIGSNNQIGFNTVITNNVVIGDNNIFTGLASVGSLGEMGTKGDIFLQDGNVSIGNNNVFREFVTINSPVRKVNTSIGDNCYFMARTHVPHDAGVRDNVVMATNSLIGGGTIVYNNAYVGLGSITHQWSDIGESAMIGLQAAVTKHVPPFCTVTGVPAKILKLNRTGLERRGYTKDVLDEVDQNFKAIIAGDYESQNELVVKIREFMLQYPECLKSFIK